ncbi:cytochrome c oxidase subunit 3 [Mariniphaga anaerophila]|uniref:Cytochrome c oxidase subunit 3 n=1 Tax=Mariniphaga anaerophila TaxID=1484053 RepID=A0A1M4WSR6_9BACT|nr:cytochrome c oxidase subunit 3 [Mariniphaga anaerophila]SHE84255.1 cytochrome c oxidase subunit 3 [Mariniphaga anaerophila]
MEQAKHVAHDHYDAEASKIGMWLFIFTELLLFGVLFVIYSVYRYINHDAFLLAAGELDTTVGAVNTVILLISSMTIAMSTTSLQKRNKLLTLLLTGVTLVLGVVFLVNKYFEWGSKFEHGIWPGSEYLIENLSQGEILFFGLYFIMTGLHALHIIIGLVLIVVVMWKVYTGKVYAERAALLDNSGLYWHLVDIIWIFLFPLFYLIH